MVEDAPAECGTEVFGCETGLAGYRCGEVGGDLGDVADEAVVRAIEGARYVYVADLVEVVDVEYVELGSN